MVDSDQSIGALGPRFGALNTTSYTAMLHASVPEKIWFYAIDRAKNEATFSALDSKFTTRIPLHPFLGCLGVAPALESRSSVVPAEHDGNMDAPEARKSRTPRRDQFEFRLRWAVTVDELMRHVTEIQPSILHFSGHGGASGLVLASERGSAQLITPRALASMIRTTT
jgi:hypothetical protein